MSVTVATNPNQSIDDSPKHYFGLSTDTKPTVASHAGLPTPTTGSTFTETNTGLLFVSYDGTNWIKPLQTRLKRVTRTKALIGGAYAAKDIQSESATNGIGTSWIFTDVVPENGGSGKIIMAQVISETSQIAPRLSLFLYNAIPTGELDDNAVNDALYYLDLATYVGKIDFPAMTSADYSTAGASEATVTPGAGTAGLPMAFVCAAADNDLYGILMSRDAFTQVAGDDMTVILVIKQT